MAFNPDARQLASAGSDGTVRVWGIPGGEEVVLLRGHQGEVRSVAFSPDGQRLVSGGIDGAVKIWDLTVHPEYSPVMVRLNDPEAIAFADKGAHLVVARRGWRLVTVDAETRAQVGTDRQVDLTSQWMTPWEPAFLDADGMWLAAQDQPLLTRPGRVALDNGRVFLTHCSRSSGLPGYG
jgi:hypothetical protein